METIRKHPIATAIAVVALAIVLFIAFAVWFSGGESGRGLPTVEHAQAAEPSFPPASDPVGSEMLAGPPMQLTPEYQAYDLVEKASGGQCHRPHHINRAHNRGGGKLYAVKAHMQFCHRRGRITHDSPFRMRCWVNSGGEIFGWSCQGTSARWRRWVKYWDKGSRHYYIDAGAVKEFKQCVGIPFTGGQICRTKHLGLGIHVYPTKLGDPINYVFWYNPK